ncbi:MAG: hypothetical protein LUD83_04225 [Clostridiales bacterium]|nr:hypothetical protein [Clostridiales bacterium]
MPHKGAGMRKQFRLISCTFRNERVLYGIPLFMDGVLLPLIIWFFLNRFGAADSSYTITNLFQTLIPICAVWWVYLVIKESLEGNGREVLYAYEPGRTGIPLRCLIAMLWYLLHTALLFLLLAGRFWSLGVQIGMAQEWLRIGAQSIFFAAFFYFLCILTRSSGASMMLTLIYYFMTAFFSQDNLFSVLSVFSMGALASASDACTLTLFTVIIGVALFFSGTGIEVCRRERI